MKVFWLAAVAVLIPGANAEAGFLDEAFAATKEGRVSCYARQYDDAHLKSHPRQKTTFFSVAMLAENADGRGNSAEDFQLQVGVEAKGGKERYYGHAYCKADGETANCFLEGDGGRMTLKPADGGRIRVEAGNYGLAFEGSDFLQIGAEESDDNVFLIDKSTDGLCAEKNPE